MRSIDTTLPDEAETRAQLVAILRQFGIRRASLFGSFARGEQHSESDIDLAIEAPTGTTLFLLAKLGSALEAAVGREVDIITFNALEGSAHPRLREHILDDMEPLPL